MNPHITRHIVRRCLKLLEGDLTVNACQLFMDTFMGCAPKGLEGALQYANGYVFAWMTQGAGLLVAPTRDMTIQLLNFKMALEAWQKDQEPVCSTASACEGRITHSSELEVSTGRMDEKSAWGPCLKVREVAHETRDSGPEFVWVAAIQYCPWCGASLLPREGV